LERDEPADSLSFLSFPDFLLGQSAAQLGGTSSNVFSSSLSYGIRDRFRAMNDYDLYVQDDFKLNSRLTLNMGLRYERFGPLYLMGGGGQTLVNFVPSKADTDPTASGSLAGYVVPSNFTGPIPTGVVQSGNTSSTNKNGLNNFGPRVGFAWQVLPHSSRFVLRGGYGIYYSHLVTYELQFVGSNQPYVVSSSNSGVANAAATFQNPFPQPFLSAASFPVWIPYTPTSAFTAGGIDPNYRPGITHQASMNLQTKLARDFLLEIGYVGKVGTDLTVSHAGNQANLASPADPIRGQTNNTASNVRLRAPLLGFAPTSITIVDSSGSSMYNALAVSLTKRFSKGLQFLASYTWAKALDDSFASEAASTSAVFGSVIGDNDHPSQRYGPSGFSRSQRLVVSYVYELPLLVKHGGPAAFLANGWSLSGVTTIQSGEKLTLLGNNTNNAYGINGTGADRAQLAAGCTYGQLVTSGSLESKLNNYFNTSCIAPYAILPGGATDFGNSGVGIVSGPGQNNFDLALAKRTSLVRLKEGVSLEFRAEAFNVFNHAQFTNPANNASLATFGQITATSVNPRIMQLALKLMF